jgi:hypothetical protein
MQGRGGIVYNSSGPSKGIDSAPGLKIFVTSRPEPAPRRAFRSMREPSNVFELHLGPPRYSESFVLRQLSQSVLPGKKLGGSLFAENKSARHATVMEAELSTSCGSIWPRSAPCGDVSHSLSKNPSSLICCIKALMSGILYVLCESTVVVNRSSRVIIIGVLFDSDSVVRVRGYCVKYA